MLSIDSNPNLTQIDFQKSYFEQIQKVGESSTNSRILTTEQKTGIEKASRGFEAIFVNMFLKEIKSGLFGSSSSMNSEESSDSLSFGGDTLMGYNQMLFSEHISNSIGGIGIANLIYKNLTGEYLTENAKEKVKEIIPDIQNILEKVKNNPEDNQTDNKSKEINIIAESSSNNESSKSTESNKPNISNHENFVSRVETRINKYDKSITEASAKYDVPVPLIKAVITAESAGKSDVISKVGAKGLMQLMDGTADYLGVENSFDPVENINGGTKYLNELLKKFDGNMKLALAAYNAGPGNVIKYDGIPPFKETQQYVEKVLAYHKKYENS